jgi:hypothetical protein
MSLLQQIKADQLQARKNRETFKATFLTTLIGEAVMVGKNNGNRESTDEEVLATIRKFLKNNLETQKLAKVELLADLEYEQRILDSYLPQQMDRTALQSLVTTYFNLGAKTKGELMKVLKAYHSGQYDGKLASEVIDEVLSRSTEAV